MQELQLALPKMIGGNCKNLSRLILHLVVIGSFDTRLLLPWKFVVSSLREISRHVLSQWRSIITRRPDSKGARSRMWRSNSWLAVAEWVRPHQWRQGDNSSCHHTVIPHSKRLRYFNLVFFTWTEMQCNKVLIDAFCWVRRRAVVKSFSRVSKVSSLQIRH